MAAAGLGGETERGDETARGKGGTVSLLPLTTQIFRPIKGFFFVIGLAILTLQIPVARLEQFEAQCPKIRHNLHLIPTEQSLE
jgi:hypothetical protein